MNDSNGLLHIIPARFIRSFIYSL